jgi:two-component system LytT family sensor kinase
MAHDMEDERASTATTPLARPRRVLVALLFWTAVGLVFTLPRLRHGAPWPATLLSALAQWWTWGLLTPFIVAIDDRLPFSATQLTRRLGVHLLLGPLFTLAYVYLEAILLALVRLGAWPRLFDGQRLADAWQGMFWSMLVYCLIVGVRSAHRYQQRYVAAELQMERLQRNFSEARLNALRMQLDPHFLFNALNTISAQLETEPRQARRMIEHLGDLLRLSLSSSRTQEIPLAEELAFLDHYLAIQKIRFGNQLQIEMEIAPDVKYAIVPSLFMQPLVENAIRHGFSRRARGGAITISVRSVDGRLDIRVLDDGVGLPPGWSLDGRGGLGLSVTRERIAVLHPNGASRFVVGNRPEGGTAVEISFPLRLLGKADGRAAG